MMNLLQAPTGQQHNEPTPTDSDQCGIQLTIDSDKQQTRTSD